MPNNSLANIYTLAKQAEAGISGSLSPDVPPVNPIRRWFMRRDLDRVHKAVGQQFMAAQAEEQGTVVSDALHLLGYYDTNAGVRDATGVTFAALRSLAANCEPATAIIEKRVTQVTPYCQLPDVKHGAQRRPGFRIRMTIPTQAPTRADRLNMARLEQYFMECGSADPPRSERPLNWQPGFEAFVSQIVRDSLTMDWVAVRRWKAKDGSSPIAAFAAEDAALVRWTRREPDKLVNGIVTTKPFAGERRNTRDEMVLVRVDNPASGGRIMEEYTEEEMVTWVRNPRTDLRANGYGYSELERGINAISAWIYARDYNVSRFRKDTLPRGILAVLGNIDPLQFDMFELKWRQMMQQGRWVTPILRGLSKENAGVQWIDIDKTSREMEYHQFMFSVALWLHAIYGIHPDETGYEALSPFRPPLSQSSPQAKLEYSQDSGLTPLMRRLAAFLNREILWKIVSDRRYTFEWVGMGEYDEMADIEMRAARLQAGLSTPRMEWSELDQELPDSVAQHPAWDLPMIFSEGVQLLITLEQAEMEKQQAEQQGQMAQEQSLQQSAQQTAGAGGPGGQPGAPQGASPAPPPAEAPGPPMPGTGSPIGQPAPTQKALRRFDWVPGKLVLRKYVDQRLTK